MLPLTQIAPVVSLHGKRSTLPWDSNFLGSKVPLSSPAPHVKPARPTFEAQKDRGPQSSFCLCSSKCALKPPHTCFTQATSYMRQDALLRSVVAARTCWSGGANPTPPRADIYQPSEMKRQEQPLLNQSTAFAGGIFPFLITPAAD